MIANRIRAAAAAALFAILASAPQAHAAPYDGSWTMYVVTTDGHCGTIRVGLAISDGHIRSTSGKFVMRPIELAGIITGSGQTKINAVAGPREAQGTGQFTKSKGTGKWAGTGPSGVCSGTWFAVRS
jgi:hypothetical protein